MTGKGADKASENGKKLQDDKTSKKQKSEAGKGLADHKKKSHTKAKPKKKD